METFLAHSARNDSPAQSYEAHTRGVYEKAERFAVEVERYAEKDRGLLTSVVQNGVLL